MCAEGSESEGAYFALNLIHILTSIRVQCRDLILTHHNHSQGSAYCFPSLSGGMRRKRSRRGGFPGLYNRQDLQLGPHDQRDQKLKRLVLH